MGELIGYGRVSTRDQNLDAQLDALRAAGCSRIFAEAASGVLRERPELAATVDYLRAGDTLVVVRLVRLGRTTRHLLDTVEKLQRRGIGFRSLGDPVDTGSAMGRFTLQLLAALSELERSLMRERADAGRAAARARGKTGGRPLAVTPKKLAAARALLASGHTTTAAARAVGVGRATLYRYLAPAAA
jgi:DNA invertase Pin-like site-specific DNA recombinase